MDRILVLDFGGQYNQLIARRVREQHVYAEIRPYNKISLEEIAAAGYKGVIFTGGPNSVYEEGSPGFTGRILEAGIPLLGICYGAQLIAHLAGAAVGKAEEGSEYGKTVLRGAKGLLFEDVPARSICWMSHTDRIEAPPAGFEATAFTDKCPVAAMADDARRIYAVQFHPEVTHTEYGRRILSNFLFGICRCEADWRMEEFVESSIARYRRSLAGKKVLLGLSGGVDSSVTAVLLHRAVGENLTCVFVDHGLLRKNEGDMVEEMFRGRFGLNILRVDAKERFLRKLEGVTEPEKKRRIIGEEFVRVFEEQAAALGRVDVLAQGTIYPDVVESGKGESAVIKSHHNVGGIPSKMDFSEIVEPLRDLFKDEVREVGRQLGIPEEMVSRQPFPGPGLAVRIIGAVTAEKISLLQEADAIFREELEKAALSRAGSACCRTAEDAGAEEASGLPQEDADSAMTTEGTDRVGAVGASGLPQKASQYFAVLTDMRSVGVKGDARTYGFVLALRCVTTDDFMTAEWTRLPYDLLERTASRILNEVADVSRVVYDITSKPPGTVEWE